jgi:hypothetical protein
MQANLLDSEMNSFFWADDGDGDSGKADYAGSDDSCKTGSDDS